MTKKRALALALSALWIALCAVSVFAADTTPQIRSAQATEAPALRLDCSRSDIERIPAEAFDEMHLTELLNITMESENDSLNTIEQTPATNTQPKNAQATNAQATNDFMQLIGANAQEQIASGNTSLKIAPAPLSANLETAKRKTSAQTLARKR